VVIFLVIINYRWRSSYQEGSVGIPLICLNPPHICARLKERPGFPTSYVVAFLCSVKRRDDCSFCWYWWKWWSSLFILSFRSHVVLSGM